MVSVEEFVPDDVSIDKSFLEDVENEPTQRSEQPSDLDRYVFIGYGTLWYMELFLNDLFGWLCCCLFSTIFFRSMYIKCKS